MLRVMLLSIISIIEFLSVFSAYLLSIFGAHILCLTAIVLSMGTKYSNKEEIVSGTPSEDSVTLRLSSLVVSQENRDD